VRHLTLEGWSKCTLLPTIPAQSNDQNLSAASFLTTGNALCCITKYVMSKCQCLFEGMRDFRTSTRTKVFRFNQKFIKVLKCSAKFKCRPVGKFRWYWGWCTNPASYKSPARWKPFSNGRCCFMQVTRCYVGVVRQASSMIWNVIRTVIGWKPLNQRIRLHFVNMQTGPSKVGDVVTPPGPWTNFGPISRGCRLYTAWRTYFAILSWGILDTWPN